MVDAIYWSKSRVSIDLKSDVPELEILNAWYHSKSHDLDSKLAKSQPNRSKKSGGLGADFDTVGDKKISGSRNGPQVKCLVPFEKSRSGFKTDQISANFITKMDVRW